MSVFKTAFSAVFRAFTGILRRDGVHIGETASYPRVELHSWTEGEPLEKDNHLREITLIVESMSTNSIAEAVKMAEDNLTMLLAENVITDGNFIVVGIIPTQLQQTSETIDTQNTLYRVMQSLSVYVEMIND